MNINTHIVISLSEYQRLKSCQEELKSLRQKYDSLKSTRTSTNASTPSLKGGGSSDLNLTLPFEVPVEESTPSDSPPVLKTDSAISSDISESKNSNMKIDKPDEDIPHEPWYYLGPPSP